MASGYKELALEFFTTNFIIILLSGLCPYGNATEFGGKYKVH